jgi:D-alanyl-D-alanine carboxypeptidase
MRLESVGKIWTAALTLRLADQGRLRLGDTVERWLPGLLPYGNRITIRQLLTMTSGRSTTTTSFTIRVNISPA